MTIATILLLSALAGLATSAIQSGVNYASQMKTNETNKEMQDEVNRINVELMNQQNTFNAEQAQLNRDFEERMSNTAHQREVADLQAAGLNPVLSANAGAAVPGGYAASGTAANAKAPVFGAPQVDMSAFSSSLRSMENIMLISALRGNSDSFGSSKLYKAVEDASTPAESAKAIWKLIKK